MWDAGLVPDRRSVVAVPEITEGAIICSTGRSVRDPQVTVNVTEARSVTDAAGARETMRPGAWKPSRASVASTVPEARSAPSSGSGLREV